VTANACVQVTVCACSPGDFLGQRAGEVRRFTHLPAEKKENFSNFTLLEMLFFVVAMMHDAIHDTYPSKTLYIVIY